MNKFKEQYGTKGLSIMVESIMSSYEEQNGKNKLCDVIREALVLLEQELENTKE